MLPFFAHRSNATIRSGQLKTESLRSAHSGTICQPGIIQVGNAPYKSFVFVTRPTSMSGLNALFGGLRRRGEAKEAETKDRADLMEDDDDFSDETPVVQPRSKRPKDNDFTQQRLKAFHPILTARTVVPFFILVAVIFIPIGAAMLKASENVQDLFIDYAYCSTLAREGYWQEIPSEFYTFHFKDSVTTPPVWRLAKNTSSVWDDYPEEQNICQVQFEIPNEVKGPLFLFYMLTNFHANHRRYVISFSEDQLNGEAASVSDIKDTVGQNCQPLSTDAAGKIYYPCGLIANSMFNDTFSPTLEGANGTDSDYVMSQEGIAWSTNKNRFKKTKYNPDDIVPPPNWVKQYPQGYNESNLPDIGEWLEFQNWMAPAALSDFSKMVARNDDDTLAKGVYQVNVGLHFPTTEYEGGKRIYLSTASAIGGKNSFLGVAWIVAGSLCLVLALVVLAGVAIRGRRSGDTALLSWNN